VELHVIITGLSMKAIILSLLALLFLPLQAGETLSVSVSLKPTTDIMHSTAGWQNVLGGSLLLLLIVMSLPPFCACCCCFAAGW
jgi:hypothetical protein